MIAFKQHLNRKTGLPKQGYPTLEIAVEAANTKTTELGTFRMVPYLCSYCNKYHIGKPTHQNNK
jgi:hypothetical protein